jgi:Ferritin-like domain
VSAGESKSPARSIPRGTGGLTRRRFLGVGTAALAVAGAGVACGGGGGEDEAPATTLETLPPLTGDVAVADLAARLENLAVDTYDALVTSASAGSLGPVPAVVGAIVTTARAQHTEHLAVWNRVMRSAGEPEVNTPDAGLKPTIDSQLAQVTDVEGAARLALLVEEILADTYLKIIPNFADKASVKAAALILATDQEHQAILRFVLGEYPVPEPLQIPDKAAS